MFKDRNFIKIKDLWQNNELGIYNRKNKATFEVFKLLCGDNGPYLFETNEGEKEIKNWQGFRSLKLEIIYNDGSSGLDENALILEPENIFRIFKKNIGNKGQIT